ncbi:hypothetical protein ACLI1A_17730 [Flavobacterium sp. RHBU_3]|uniref:hypothetical protein n=1 Tax=Flavobacterium sp. RHBU_3 TaxID=3391184 RepID=UPI003984BA3D
MMKKFVLLLSVLCAFGCKPLLVKLYGIKNPSFVTEEKIKKYLLKKDIDTTGLLYTKDLKAWQDVLSIGMPNAYFFNAKGEYVNYKKTASDCNAKVGSFIEDLKSLNTEPSDKEFTLEKMFGKLSSYNGKPTEVTGYDGYVLITWATYVGKLNRDKSFDWVELIKTAQSKGVNVKMCLINGDLQEKWGMSEEEKSQLDFDFDFNQ